jgi:hypothetical protein
MTVPENVLADLTTLLTQLMVYGTAADVALFERYVPLEEFRKVLEHAPPGVVTKDAWKRWHERFQMLAPPLPRRRFPNGSVGPEAGNTFGLGALRQSSNDPPCI